MLFQRTVNDVACGSTLVAFEDNQRTAISLNVLASKFYAAGQQCDAIAMIDLADEVLGSSDPPCPELLVALQWGEQKISQLDASATSFQTHPNDLYLDGECDVGPRPIRSPLHMDASMLAQSGEPLLRTILAFNKGLALHSKSDLEGAIKFYRLSLASLSRVTTSAPASDSISSKNRLSQLGMVIHNNMGQLSYIDGDENDSRSHFETAVLWGRKVENLSQDKDFQLLLALVTSNYCRAQWTRQSIEDETLYAFEQVLKLRSFALPEDHPDVACSYFNLGLLQHARHCYDEARVYLQKYLSYATKNSLFGLNNELDAIPAITLILVMENESKEDQLSIDLVRALYALQDKRDDCGRQHMEIASILNYVGTLLFHQKDLYSAILFYREELRIEKALLSTEVGINVSVTYNNIGRILQELGKFQDAIACYRRALRSELSSIENTSPIECVSDEPEVALSEDLMKSPSTANLFSTIWYNLGLIHDKMGARDEAIQAFKTSLNLRKTMLGADHPDVACLWYNIGTLQMEQNQLAEASTSFKEALRIRRLGKFSEEAKHLLSTMQKLASLQQSKGKIAGALSTLEEILHIHESSEDAEPLARAPISMAMTLYRMSELRHAQGDLSESMQLAHRAYDAIRIAPAFFDDSSPYHTRSVEETAHILLQLGSLYHESCDAVQAIELFKQARKILERELSQQGRQFSTLHTLLEASRFLADASCAPQA